MSKHYWTLEEMGQFLDRVFCDKDYSKKLLELEALSNIDDHDLSLDIYSPEFLRQT